MSRGLTTTAAKMIVLGLVGGRVSADDATDIF
jgi:hypothetical protein